VSPHLAAASLKVLHGAGKNLLFQQSFEILSCIRSGIGSIDRNDNLELCNARTYSNQNKCTCERAIIPSQYRRSINFNSRTKSADMRGAVRRYIGILWAVRCEKIFNSFYVHNGMRSAMYTSDIEFQQRGGFARKIYFYTRRASGTAFSSHSPTIPSPLSRFPIVTWKCIMIGARFLEIS